MSGFNFTSEYDAEQFASFKAMKKNNGFFKSAKHRDFIVRCHGDENTSSIVQLQAGEFIAYVNAYMRWVDYGRRSVRRVEWIFIFDKFGLKKQVKPKFNYDDARNTSWFSGEVELVWERDSSIELPVFEDAAPTPVSEHVGVVGNRSAFCVRVTKVRSFGIDVYGNYRFQTVLKTESGSVIVYWNTLNYKAADGASEFAKEGDLVKFSATIKEHGEYNGTKQTIISRATKVEVVKE